jgi:hypothetical protein
MSGPTMPATVAEFAAEPFPFDATRAGGSMEDLVGLRRHLELGLANLIHGWDDRPSAPLRITKGRVRTAAVCPAQIRAEIGPFAVDFNVAVGVVCDAAAGVLAVHPHFAADDGWYRALNASLAEEHSHVVAYVDGLDRATRAEFEDRVDELCRALPTLMGDLRPLRPMVHRRTSYRVVDQGDDLHVLLTGEMDLVVGTGTRLLVEVKSGPYRPRVADELLHYGLIVALAGLEMEAPPVMGCALTLGDLALTPVEFTIEKFETAVGRILDAARVLIELDQAAARGERPTTRPGDHCLWCRRVTVCPAAPDLVLAQLGDGRADSPTDHQAHDAMVGHGHTDDDQGDDDQGDDDEARILIGGGIEP